MTEEIIPTNGTSAEDVAYAKKVKEIYIDGVNVAGCEYYKGKCMEYTHYCQIGCKECTDIGIKLCHYKQTERFKAKIDRLEQENKELKEWNKNIKAHKDFLFKENDKLMRNNSIIRFALNEIKDITTNALAKQRPYKEDFIDIQDIINKTVERQEKNIYRSALEEIRGLLSPHCTQCSQVLDIINEVLGDET